MVLILFFGRSWGNNLAAFFFVSMLLPIVLGTSYFFNYFLVPRFFMKKRFFNFGLYTFYLIVVSIYLETLVLLISFMYFTNFSIDAMGPNAYAIVMLGLVMYLLVFIGSFLLLARQVKEKQLQINDLIIEKKKMEVSCLEVMSNRKTVRTPFDEILYIESLKDNIKIHKNDDFIISKEKISNIEKRLPDIFVRIHRSFIANKNKISSVTSSEIEIGGIILNVGRNYRENIKEIRK